MRRPGLDFYIPRYRSEYVEYILRRRNFTRQQLKRLGMTQLYAIYLNMRGAR